MKPPTLTEGAVAIVMLFAGLVAPVSLYLRGAEPDALLFGNLALFSLGCLFLCWRSSWWALGWLGFPLVVALNGRFSLGAVFLLLPVATSWTCAVRTTPRPVARRVGWAHVVFYTVVMHPFAVTDGPGSYRRALGALAGLDPDGAAIADLGRTLAPVFAVLIGVALLAPGLLLADLAMWSLRAERDRRRAG